MRKFINIYLLVFFCTLGNYVCAQSTFLKYYRYGWPESDCQGYAIREKADGELVLLFRYGDQISRGTDFGFLELNASGDSVRAQVFPIRGSDFINDFVMDDSILYCVGTFLDSNSQVYDRAFYRVNLGDSSSNSYQYFRNPQGSIGEKVLMNQGMIYLIGHEYNGSKSLDVSIQKLSKDGALIFKKYYGGAKADWVYSAAFSNDGGILMTGASYNGSTYEAKILTIKVDTNGNEIWRNITGIEDDSLDQCRAGGFDVVQAPNGNVFIVGSTANWCVEDLEERGRDRSLLICLDSNGNYLWTKKEVFADKFQMQSYGEVYVTQSNNLICVGQLINDIDNFPGYQNIDILIAAYDLNGNKIWHRRYGADEFQDYIYNSSMTKNGSILITGRYESALQPFNDVRMYAMKVDPCGCLVPGCDPNCIVSTGLNLQKVLSIEIYPNPARDYLDILQLEGELELKVYSLQGRLLYVDQVMDTQRRLSLQSWSEGLYLFHFRNKKGQQKSFRVMIE